MRAVASEATGRAFESPRDNQFGASTGRAAGTALKADGTATSGDQDLGAPPWKLNRTGSGTAWKAAGTARCGHRALRLPPDLEGYPERPPAPPRKRWAPARAWRSTRQPSANTR